MVLDVIVMVVIITVVDIPSTEIRDKILASGYLFISCFMYCFHKYCNSSWTAVQPDFIYCFCLHDRLLSQVVIHLMFFTCTYIFELSHMASTELIHDIPNI
jgi:hypothetical protein